MPEAFIALCRVSLTARNSSLARHLFGAVTVTKLAPQALLGAQRPGKTGENWVATQKSQNRKWPSERFSLLHLLRRFLGCLSAPADLVLASFFRFLKDFTLCMHIQASPSRRRYAAEAPRGRRGRGSRINFGKTHDSHRSYRIVSPVGRGARCAIVAAQPDTHKSESSAPGDQVATEKSQNCEWPAGQFSCAPSRRYFTPRAALLHTPTCALATRSSQRAAHRNGCPRASRTPREDRVASPKTKKKHPNVRRESSP